jgi:hypothetical protein
MRCRAPSCWRAKAGKWSAGLRRNATQRCPTHRQNSHANHTWVSPSRQSALFSSSGSTAGVGSIPIARSTSRQHQAAQEDRIGVNTLIRWESLGNRRRGRVGLMASRKPALPLDSHIQSHAEVFKNELCEFPRSPHGERSRVAGLGPEAVLSEVCFAAAQLAPCRSRFTTCTANLRL